MSTFKEMYGVDPSPKMLADKHYKEGPTPVVAPDLVVGLELEIEKWGGENRAVGFEFKEDNSLRGDSIEAITKPTKTKFVEDLLNRFYTSKKITADNFSERCGTHVHVNISDMTPEQLATFCMLYQVFERPLFKYVGDERDNNIFCVPWEQAGINYDLLYTLKTLKKTKGWKKYTALNLVPVVDYGSVEFRHLPGTCDVKYMMGWLNLIGCIHNFSMINNHTEVQQRVIDLNTSSAYSAFASDVFGVYTELLDNNNLNSDMETGVINVKLMSVSDYTSKKNVEPKKLPFDDVVPTFNGINPPTIRLRNGNTIIPEQAEAPLLPRWAGLSPIETTTALRRVRLGERPMDVFDSIIAAR